jgi:PKHD-type hydroxylase
MILKHYYWYFKSALSNKFCDDLIKYAKTKEIKIGLTGELTAKQAVGQKINKKDINKLKKKRNSDVVWLNDRWIYNEIHPYIHEANKNAGWNFQWDFSESCQFTKYSKGQHYHWHCDSFQESFNSKDLNYNGKIRKLSVSCLLSDSKEYSGGELEFQFRDTDEPNKIHETEKKLPKGSIIVFPSHIWHRVKPVTKGIRYSLVIWNIGYPFK